MTKIKIGSGFDAHRFSPPLLLEGNTITLCGVDIPCPYSVVAHSDGDVALHSLTDAILGSISAGDIGIHFPPNDMSLKGENSKKFIEFACKKLHIKGGVINNVDLTIIAEVPKISLYRESLIKSIANILNISEEDVSVKATTTEKLGFTGRKEGIACQAIVCVSLVD